MNKSAQKGSILPLLVVGLLLIGILITTGLVKVPQIFKPKAGGTQIIYFTGPNVSKNPDGQFVTSDYFVDVALHSPFGPSIWPTPFPFSTPLPYPSDTPPPYPKPFPTPTTLSCGGFANLPCPQGYQCINLPQEIGKKDTYPDQGGICVPSNVGYPVPPTTSCSDMPCPFDYACLSVNNKSFCVNTNISTGTPNKSPVEYVQQIAQSQTQRSALDSQASEAIIDSNLPIPSDINVKCRINPGNEPTIDKLDVNWDVPANASEIKVYLDDASKPGWSGNCDKTYPGDACQKVAPSQESAELTIKEGELYNVWVEYKDENGRLSKPSKKLPVVCKSKPPVKISTVAFRLAESEDALNYTSFRPYQSDFNSSTSNDGTIIVSHYFYDLNSGTKTVWVQFLGSDGKISSAESASIIVQPSASPTPTPPSCDHPFKCPFPTTLPGQNCTWNYNDDPCSCPNIVCTSTSTPSPTTRLECTGSRGAAILVAFARGESAADLANLYVVYGCLTRQQAEVANAEAASYYQQYGVAVNEGQINDMLGGIEAGIGPARDRWRQPKP